MAWRGGGTTLDVERDKRVRRGAGDRESKALDALWACEQPLTATEMPEAVGGRLAYATVQTMLTRRIAQRVAQRQQERRAVAYSPILDHAAQAAARAAFGPATRRLSRTLPPATMTRLISLGGFLASTSSTASVLVRLSPPANPGRRTPSPGASR